MPAWPITLAPQSAATVAITSTTELVAVVTAPVVVDGPTRTVTLSGVLVVTSGAATTTLTVRARRNNGITGTALANPIVTPVANATQIDVPFAFSDQPGEVAGLVYSVTVQQTGGGASGVVNVAIVAGVVF